MNLLNKLLALTLGCLLLIPQLVLAAEVNILSERQEFLLRTFPKKVIQILDEVNYDK